MSKTDEQIIELEKELQKTPYNKKTQHHIGKLKAKISMLRDKSESSGKGSGGEGFNVKKTGDATIVLVGFPSVGKSTLLNALTGARVYVEDRLFATLDATTRKLALSGGQTVLLSDTVGFIRKLPHHLIASFRSTLTEVAEADLILKILDASSPRVMEHFEAINEVLGDLGLSDRPSRVVLNKLDAIDDDGTLAQLQRQFPDAVVISARQRLRLDRLEAAISEAYSQDFDQVQLRVPPEQSRLINAVYEALEVKERTFDKDTTVLTVRGPLAVIQSFQSKLADGV